MPHLVGPSGRLHLCCSSYQLARHEAVYACKGGKLSLHRLLCLPDVGSKTR